MYGGGGGGGGVGWGGVDGELILRIFLSSFIYLFYFYCFASVLSSSVHPPPQYSFPTLTKLFCC